MLRDKVMMNGNSFLLHSKFVVAAAFISLLALPMTSRADIPCGEVAAKTTGVTPSNPIQGNTPQQIHERFTSIIENNFRTGKAETIIHNLSAKELNDLAVRYKAESTLGTEPLLAIFAKRLSDRSLVKVATAFGVANVQSAVNAYSSSEVKAAFASDIATVPVTSGVTPMAGPAPTVDMTIQEIYLEFRTAPIGSLSVEGALSETAMFAGKDIAISWWIGTQIGNQINNAINEYDPSLGDAIGGTVSGMVNAIQNAANDVQQGELLKSIDDLFDLPVWDSGDYQGDYDDFEPMLDYFDYVSVGGGGCV